MNVLSLFDGMSCGQIALKELGIIPAKYYASEIDKFAIAQTQLNFPNTIQLGSVLDVDVSKLEPIDMILAGSPCTNFSAAGKRNGMSTVENEEIYTLDRYLQLKEEGFQFEGQSYLFWEYMRILTDIRKYNPGVKFLLENVEMGDKWERVLSEAIGVFGVHINSALVSAQNRKRIYFTNIRVKEVGLFGELHSDIPQPKDEGILLKDILEEEVDEKYYYSEKAIQWIDRHSIRKNKTLYIFKDIDKFPCLEATMYKKYSSQRFWAISDFHGIRYITPTECARLQTIPEWYKCESIETICQNFNSNNICQQYANQKDVINQSQVKKLACATNTILGLLETVKQNYQDMSLIRANNVAWKVAVENNKQASMSASCTINDLKSMGLLNCLNELTSQNLNVNFVLKRLEEMVVLECAISTTKCGKFTEILYIPKKTESNQAEMDIIEILMENNFIGKLQKKLSEENLSKELRLSITLTLINLIMSQVIWSYLRKPNTHLYINSSIELQENSLELKLSNIKMDRITKTSDSSIYKMLGNGWTVKVIMHILKYLK